MNIFLKIMQNMIIKIINSFFEMLSWLLFKILSWLLFLKGVNIQEAITEFQNSVAQAEKAEYEYSKNCDLQSLENALDIWEEVLEHFIFPSSSVEVKTTILNNSGNCYIQYYWETSDLDSLDNAIICWEKAMEIIPSKSPDLPLILSSLGNGVRERYLLNSNLNDLMKFIEVNQQAMELTPTNNSDELSIYLNNLAIGLNDRYVHTGCDEDIEQSMKYIEEAIKLTPKDSSYLPSRLNNLGLALSDKYDKTGNIEDLRKAIEKCEQSVQLTPKSSPELPRQLNTLGDMLRKRYIAIGNESDLTKAIKICEQAVNLTSSESTDLPGHLDTLGACYSERYDSIGNLEDFTRAIDLHEKAVNLTPQESPYLPISLSNLGDRFFYRYLQTSDLLDLSNSIAKCEQAVTLTPENSPDLPIYLNNLSNGLRQRYRVTGNFNDLEKSIEVCDRIIKSTVAGKAYLPSYLGNLSNGLSDRYMYIGDLNDLTESINYLKQAIQLLPDDSPELPSYLNDLSKVLRHQYTHNKELNILEESIKFCEQGINFSYEKSPSLPTLLENKGLALHDYFEHTGKINTLIRGIQSVERAINVAPEKSPELPGYFSSLSDMLHSYYQRDIIDFDALERAIKNSEKAISLTPLNSPDLPNYLNLLGVELYHRHFHQGNPDDLKQAIENYQKATLMGLEVNVQAGLYSAMNWINGMFLLKQWEQVKQPYDYAYQASIHLLKIQIFRHNKETWLKEIQGLAAKAAYALAKNNKLQQAVVALESGLARLLSEALARDRADLEQLKALGHTDLYDRYKQLIVKWHIFTQQRKPDLDNLRATRNELDATIEAIQQVQGFEQFLKPPTFATIQQAAQDTTLIYILATEAGGLALLVGEKIIPVSLPALTDTDLHNILNNEDQTGYLDIYFKREENKNAWYTALDTTTSWLWQTVMAPIIDMLPLQAKITLIPVGLLALLPLHAAWTKDSTKPTGKCYVLDDFSVTYAPNALALTKAKSIVDNISSESLLAIDEPQPVEADSLPNSQYEVKTITAQFKNAKTLEHEAASCTAVLNILKNSTILHFSCHGKAYLNQPLKNGLLMSNHKEITLKDILNLRLQGIRLATLSACETGMIGTQLPDEFVNFSSGLLQAGCAGVVASLWSLSNNVSSMFLMIRFYEFWRQKNLEPPEALCQAQIWVRDSSNAEKWAYLEQSIEDTELSSKTFKRFKKEIIGFDPKEDKRFAHPYYWAAFTYTGV